MNITVDYCSSFQFIINPSAGQGRYKQIIQSIHDILSGSGVKYDIKVLEYRGEAFSLAKKTADDHDVVVAVGGDGTVNEVFSGILGTQAVFGIIPAGTGNGFAKALGLPLKPEKACQVLVEGYAKEIDVGVANGRYFLGTAGVGFDALIAEFAGEKLGPLRGMWLYFFAGALTFHRFSPPPVDMEIDSEIVKVTPLVIAIANTRRYGGKALIAPEAKPDDGLLDVCVIKDMSAFRLVCHLHKLFAGRHVNLPDVTMHKGRKIVINSPEPIPLHVDGEAAGSYARVEFTILPKAIRVLVPGVTHH